MKNGHTEASEGDAGAAPLMPAEKQDAILLIEGQLASLKKDQAEALSVYQQTVGAISVCEQFLKMLKHDDISSA